MRLTGDPGKCSDPAYTDLSFRAPSSLDYRLNQPRRRRRSHAASPGTRYTGPSPNRRRHGEQLPARGPRPGGAQERPKHPGLRPVRRRSLRHRRQERRLLRELQGGHSRRDLYVLWRETWLQRGQGLECQYQHKDFHLDGEPRLQIVQREVGPGVCHDPRVRATFGLTHGLGELPRHAHHERRQRHCQDTQRILGRGDVLALDGKYP